MSHQQRSSLSVVPPTPIGKKTRQRMRRLQIDPACESCGCELTLNNSCLKKPEKLGLPKGEGSLSQRKLLLCISCSRRKNNNLGVNNKNNRMARVRRKFWERDPHCHYCRRSLTFIESTLDHVKPRSKGGSGKQSNLVLSCLPCNLAKADMPVEEFLAEAS